MRAWMLLFVIVGPHPPQNCVVVPVSIIERNHCPGLDQWVLWEIERERIGGEWTTRVVNRGWCHYRGETVLWHHDDQWFEMWTSQGGRHYVIRAWVVTESWTDHDRDLVHRRWYKPCWED